MPDGVPDCPKCAVDEVFADWLQAHRIDAVEGDRHDQLLREVARILVPHVGHHAVANGLADQLVDLVEDRQRVTVWAHWADMIRQRAAAQSTSEEQR